MSELHDADRPAVIDLDRALDDLSPRSPVDDAALARAFRRLTAEMTADPATDLVHRARLARTGVGSPAYFRRRAIAALAVAAVGAGAVVAGHLAGSPGGRPGTAAASRGGASSQALISLAALIRSQPAPAAGQMIKITETSTQTLPAHDVLSVTHESNGQLPPGNVVTTVTGHVPARTTTQTTVTYRPSDLSDSTTQWVMQRTSDGTTYPAVSARCDGFDVARSSVGPCRPGDWDDPTPSFLASLAAQPPSAVSAALVGHLAGTVKAGDSMAPAALFEVWTWLQSGAGDPALLASAMDALAAVAAHESDDALTVRNVGGVYTITAQGPAAETITVNLGTGEIAESGRIPSGETMRSSITTSVVSRTDVPAATAYRPVTPAGGASAAPGH